MDLFNLLSSLFFFFFNDTATTEIYTLSLHDALPISRLRRDHHRAQTRRRGRAGLAGRPRGAPAVRRDRKSTRLNSSHANISYAVFCLEKKKGLVLSIDLRTTRRACDQLHPGQLRTSL